MLEMIGRFGRSARRRGVYSIGLAACLLSMGCSTPGFLSESESKLGIGRTAYLGTALSAYHTALLEPAGLALRFPGYVIGVEKIQSDAGRERTVTHVVRYQAPGSGADGHSPRPCVLMARLQPSPMEKSHLTALDDPSDMGLYDVCPDWNDTAYSAEMMRRVLEQDMRVGNYTHVFLIVMGWNTQSLTRIGSMKPIH
jgi:hypothetical protein